MRLSRRTLVIATLLLSAIIGIKLWQSRRAETSSANSSLSPEAVRQLAAALTALEHSESQVERTHWGPELLAQQCGSVLENLWDSLNLAPDKFEILNAFSPGPLKIPQWQPPNRLAHGIEQWVPANADGQAGNWTQILSEIRSNGWQLAQLELRHNLFETNRAGQPSRSVFYVRGDFSNLARQQRATLSGDVAIEWADLAATDGLPRIKSTDASQLRLLQRTGAPPFELILDEVVRPIEKSNFIDPLLVYDLDGDGTPEIILAAKNLVFQRQSDGTYARRPLCLQPPGLVLTAVIADFDGDGLADFLCAVYEGLILYHGSKDGTFNEPGKLVWAANPHLKYGQVLTCGDIDRDGDLDLWLGQYKNPYERGQMPTPYYGANDGFPSYLLLNDGHGTFKDATEAAGLGGKNRRRCYAASLVDWSGQGRLDLVTVSDFAGVDIYENDGQGHFTDRTTTWLPENKMFGMGHAVADFDGDGRLDLLVMGMHCPTALRLEHLGLSRPDKPDYSAMRRLMTQGNRLFLGQAKEGFHTGKLEESIRHSGWSWGCSALDWDNDGYPDVYIVNGHETRQTVKDYEPEFWLHDIYVGNSQDDLVKSAYFGGKIARTRGHGQSYGGYEKNRFFLNQQGQSFVEAGYLMGAAVEQDSRNLVTADLDADGRADLIFTTFEAWPQKQQTLKIYRNRLEDSGHWIGFHLREKTAADSPIGATITVHSAGKTAVREIITGDSHRSQHPHSARFGLGTETQIESVEVRWQSGKKLNLEHPAIDRYHIITPSN